MTRGAMVSRDSAALMGTFVLFVSACAGGAPLLHPAHVLPAGRVAAGAGASGQFLFGERNAERAPRSGVASDPEQQYLERTVTDSSVASGLAPWVSARAGAGLGNEAGLTYTGRALRVDGRHAFGDDTVAVSVGLGASAVLMHLQAPEAPPGQLASPENGRFATADAPSAGGFGADLPVLVGWRSTASVVEVWAGARAGFERIRGDLELAQGSTPAVATAMRWYGGGLVGAAVGIRPVWVALELDVAYQALSVGADFPGGPGAPPGPPHRDANLSFVTVAPAGAIIGKF
jgi:hypothetical protein